MGACAKKECFGLSRAAWLPKLSNLGFGTNIGLGFGAKNDFLIGAGFGCGSGLGFGFENEKKGFLEGLIT
ncbi:MAG: hypothetical protein V1839_01100, partial [archaeon]